MKVRDVIKQLENQRQYASMLLRMICSLLPLANPVPCHADEWLCREAATTDKIVIVPLQGGSGQAHDHTDMAAQMTGIPQTWEAETTAHGTIRRFLGAIHYQGSLSNGKHWPPFFYYTHLEECPQIDIELETKDRRDGGFRQSESLRLYLWKFRRHYWLEQRDDHSRPDLPRGGMVPMGSRSLRRLLSLLQALVAQGKRGIGGLELVYPPGD